MLDFTNVTLVHKDDWKFKAHRVILAAQMTRMPLCHYYQNGFCKYRHQCVKKHVDVICPSYPSCQNTECDKRHPRPCRMFSRFGNCKFEKCAYIHDSDSGKYSNIEELKNEIVELKKSVKKLSENSQSEAKIKTLEEEVNILKLEIKRLFAFTKKVRKIDKDISDVKIQEETPAEKVHEESPGEKIQEETSDKKSCEEVSDVSEKTKFKCNLCGSQFKKEITLKKHMNTKHDPKYCPSNEKIGEGKFGFALNARPENKEAATEQLRLELSKENKDESNLNEKEVNKVNDKAGREDQKHSVSDDKSKECESEHFDFEDYFQIEVVDGESLFVCNVCDEGFENEQEIKEHIKNNHESLLNDDSYDDIDLYEGFDEEGHRIV